MKKIILIFLIIQTVYTCIGQITQPNSAPSYDQLKINSAPAFTILGTDPDNIQRPSTPKQVVSGIQNSINGGKIQPALAFEISPYYWTDSNEKYRFHAADYLLPNQSILKTMLKNFSISAGTSSSD